MADLHSPFHHIQWWSNYRRYRTNFDAALASEPGIALGYSTKLGIEFGLLVSQLERIALHLKNYTRIVKDVKKFAWASSTASAIGLVILSALRKSRNPDERRSLFAVMDIVLAIAIVVPWSFFALVWHRHKRALSATHTTLAQSRAIITSLDYFALEQTSASASLVPELDGMEYSHVPWATVESSE